MSSAPQGRALVIPTTYTGSREGWSVARRVLEVGAPSDEALMVQVQANDPAALELLFDRYSRLVLTIARGIVRDSGEAEDVVQEVFFYLYRKAALFDGSKGSVKNWILQIGLHRALDRKAHLARRGFYAGTEISSVDDILLGETDLEREIGAKLDHALLGKAFQHLPELQRLTLELFYFEGLELREISEKLGEPLGNTRHHFYRGLERLRKNAFVQSLRGSK